MIAPGAAEPDVVRLVRNPNWRRSTDLRPAAVSEIDLHGGFTNVDLMGRAVLFGSGEITETSPLTPALLRLVSQGHRNQLAVFGANSLQLIRLDTTVPPLNNVNVRRAVLAIAWTTASGPCWPLAVRSPARSSTNTSYQASPVSPRLVDQAAAALTSSRTLAATSASLVPTCAARATCAAHTPGLTGSA